jgi:hypothetical protein
MSYEGVCADYYVAPTGDALWELMIVEIENGAKGIVTSVEHFRTEPVK